MPIRIGTASHDSTFLSQGNALKIVLDRDPALAPVEVKVSPGDSVENARRLDENDIDFGFTASNWIGRAKNGEPPFDRATDVRMVAPVNAGPLFFITRAETPLRKVTDLRGRRVAVGQEKSGMTQHAHLILRILGLTFSDIMPLYLDFAGGADALARGEVDAQFQCPVPNKIMTALAERTALRVLTYQPGELEAVLKAVAFYRRAVMRKGAIRGLDADTAQPGVVNILMTHARVPDDTVRAVTSAIIAAREELPRLNALFTGMTELFDSLPAQGAQSIEFGGVVLHPGALAAYKAAGLL
jgi:TRAP transporter TAXI family solute receptor